MKLIISLALFFSFLIAQEATQAKIVSITGSSEIKDEETEKSSKAVKGASLYSHQIIHVTSGQMTIQLLHDNTEFTLREGTEMKIDEIADEETGFFHSISLMAGSIWAKVTKITDKPPRYQVVTPTLTAAVRGTDFDVSVADDGSSHVGVDNGHVEVVNIDEDETISVKDNESIESDHTSTISKKVAFVRNKFEHGDWVRIRNERFKKNPGPVFKHWAEHAKKWEEKNSNLREKLGSLSKENAELKSKYINAKRNKDERAAQEINAKLRENLKYQTDAVKKLAQSRDRFSAQNRMSERVSKSQKYAHFKNQHGKFIDKLRSSYSKHKANVEDAVRNKMKEYNQHRKEHSERNKERSSQERPTKDSIQKKANELREKKMKERGQENSRDKMKQKPSNQGKPKSGKR